MKGDGKTEPEEQKESSDDDEDESDSDDEPRKAPNELLMEVFLLLPLHIDTVIILIIIQCKNTFLILKKEIQLCTIYFKTMRNN